MTKKKPHEIDVHVGRQIKIARILAGLSQTGLAAQLGLTFQQLQKYETGANRVSASRLWEIARIVGKGVGTFFPEGTAPAEADVAGKREQLELARNMARLEPAIRKHMHGLARSLAHPN